MHRDELAEWRTNFSEPQERDAEEILTGPTLPEFSLTHLNNTK